MRKTLFVISSRVAKPKSWTRTISWLILACQYSGTNVEDAARKLSYSAQSFCPLVAIVLLQATKNNLMKSQMSFVVRILMKQ